MLNILLAIDEDTRLILSRALTVANDQVEGIKLTNRGDSDKLISVDNKECLKLCVISKII